MILTPSPKDDSNSEASGETEILGERNRNIPRTSLEISNPNKEETYEESILIKGYVDKSASKVTINEIEVGFEASEDKKYFAQWMPLEKGENKFEIVAYNQSVEIDGEYKHIVIKKEKPKYKVLEIVDGDTIKINYNDQKEKVRLIGIDTPETNECFSTEATNKLLSLIGEKEIEIEFDTTQGERDKYSRLLLYIWLDDKLINKTMIAEGYAHEYTYNLPYKYQTEFKEAQREAQSHGKGLWGDACYCQKDSEKNRTCIGCNLAEIEYYNWDCSTYKKQVEDTSCKEGCEVYTPPSSTTTTILPSYPPPAQTCKYACDGPDKDCNDFSTQAEAQEFFNCCGFTKDYDPMRLDGIGVDDGIPCESLP